MVELGSPDKRIVILADKRFKQTHLSRVIDPALVTKKSTACALRVLQTSSSFVLRICSRPTWCKLYELHLE